MHDKKLKDMKGTMTFPLSDVKGVLHFSCFPYLRF